MCTAWELTQISIDLVCSREFLIQVCWTLPMSSQLQLSSRVPRSLDLLLKLNCLSISFVRFCFWFFFFFWGGEGVQIPSHCMLTPPPNVLLFEYHTCPRNSLVQITLLFREENQQLLIKLNPRSTCICFVGGNWYKSNIFVYGPSKVFCNLPSQVTENKILNSRITKNKISSITNPENIAKFQFPETQPWTWTPLNINLFEIAHAKKSDTNPAFYQAAHKRNCRTFSWL